MSFRYYDNEYFRKRDHLDLHIAESIRILMKENGLRKVLDVGCGTGKLVEFLNKNGFTAVGCDNAEEAVKISGQVKASATNLPFADESFDMVTAISVIEHLTETEAHDFTSEARRVLNAKGIIFLVTPNFASPLRLIRGRRWFGYSDPTHKTFYTPQKLSLLLRSYGFERISFRFKIAKNVPFDWHLPTIFRKLPPCLKYFLTYLMISSQLSTLRDSFWIAAQKPGKL